jgi:phenazine biosynthesis protein phzE
VPEGERKARLLEFLADEKEIYELFMVVDEELKMMCDVCDRGGQVLGPFLKPMTHLVHTEYLLAGRSTRDVRTVLRDTMFAATVTGAPVENACRLIAAYEAEGRGYYGAALALLGRDPGGAPTADSPIVIRTAEVSPDGAVRVSAGATLVRDSDPAHEVAETHAKAGGILTALGLLDAPPTPVTGVEALTQDEDVLIALASRNQRLSRFWLTEQGAAAPVPELKGRRVLVLEGEDDFSRMLGHVLEVLGMSADLLPHEEYVAGALEGYDLVVVGPGPGDPRDGSSPKVAVFREVTEELLAGSRPFLSVCLGHQVLCDRLGLPLAFKDIVFQGTQARVDLAPAVRPAVRPAGAREEVVGFYNTFVARPDGALPEGVRVATDPATGDVHAIAGTHFRGVQFHAESILTENGYPLLRDLVLELLAKRPS